MDHLSQHDIVCYLLKSEQNLQFQILLFYDKLMLYDKM